jgi:hypothetical protein
MVILDAPVTHTIMLHTDDTGQHLCWNLAWLETHGKSMKMYVAPSFYFYSLMHDILPLKANTTLQEALEEVQEWITLYNFDIDTQDVDSEGFYLHLTNKNIQLHLKDFHAAAQKPFPNTLKTEYMGTISIEMVRVQNECDINIKFFGPGVRVPTRKYYECNIISMNKLKFEELEEESEEEEDVVAPTVEAQESKNPE